MALKKFQFYISLWQSCAELRVRMDASQYKDCMLKLLFMKYVSDKYADRSDAVIELPKGGSFGDMVKLKGDLILANPPFNISDWDGDRLRRRRPEGYKLCSEWGSP